MFNHNFGILIDNKLEYAPKGGMIGEKWVSAYTDMELIELGYKPIVHTNKPDTDDVYTYTWIEVDNIITENWYITHYTTNAERREHVYESRPCIEYGDDTLTIDKANDRLLKYLAEGNDAIVSELRELIAVAKNDIRAEYPDENGDTNV